MVEWLTISDSRLFIYYFKLNRQMHEELDTFLHFSTPYCFSLERMKRFHKKFIDILTNGT